MANFDVSGLASSATQIASQAASFIVNSVSSVAKSGIFTDFISAIGKGISSITPTIVDSLKNGVSVVSDMFSKVNISNLFSFQALQGVKDIFDNIKIGSITENFGKGILSIINKDSASKVSDLIKRVGDNFKALFNQGPINILGSGKIGERLTELFQNTNLFNPSSIVSNLKDKISERFLGLKDSGKITSLDSLSLKNFKDTFNEKFGSIQEKIDGYKEKLGEMGINGVINDKLDEAKNKLNEQVNELAEKYPLLGKLLGKTAEEAETIDQEQASEAASEVKQGKDKNSKDNAKKGTQFTDIPLEQQFAVYDKNGKFLGVGVGTDSSGKEFKVLKEDGSTTTIDNSGDEYLLKMPTSDKPTTTFMSKTNDNSKKPISGSYDAHPEEYSNYTQCVSSTRDMYEKKWGQTLPELGKGGAAAKMDDKVKGDPDYVVTDTPIVGAAVVIEAGEQGFNKTSGHLAICEEIYDDGTIKIADTNAKKSSRTDGKGGHQIIDGTSEGVSYIVPASAYNAYQYGLDISKPFEMTEEEFQASLKPGTKATPV